MNVTLAFALLSFLFLGSPVYAQIYPQSRCLDCLKADRDQLKQYLDSAISQEDKKSCAERQEAQTKVCEKGDCEIERAKDTNRYEAPHRRNYGSVRREREARTLHTFVLKRSQLVASWSVM